jgi:hypothetical protein
MRTFRSFGYFLIAPRVARFGHLVGTDRTHFALIAPFEDDSDKWLDMEYVNRHSGKLYRISILHPDWNRGHGATADLQGCAE